MRSNFLFFLSRKLNYPFVAPEVLQISVTYRCNLKCKMCSICNMLPENEELSMQQICKVLNEAKAYGIKKVLFTGGEPFLREDFLDICHHANKIGLQVIVTTNASWNDDALDDIANLRIDHLHISLDGVDGTNDFFRGPGQFERVVKNIKRLSHISDRRFSLGIACTVMKENVTELLAMVKLADSLKIQSINFQPLIADNSHFAQSDTPEFWLTSEDIVSLKTQIEQIRALAFKYVMLYEEPSLDLLVKYYQKKLTTKDWICFGGFKTAFVCFEKGKPLLYSCHGICGDLDTVSLKEAWQSQEAKKLRKHSAECKNLCLQSCYSIQNAESLLKCFR